MSGGEIRATLGEKRLERLRVAAAALEISEQELLRRALDAYAPPERHQPAVETPPDRRQIAAGEGGKGDGVLGGRKEHGGTEDRREGRPVQLRKVSSPLLFDPAPGGDPTAGDSDLAPADEFDVFWAAYPRKEARKDAEKAWRQTARSRPPIDELLGVLRAQSAARGWPSQFTPLAASYLRGERWKDPAAPPGAQQEARASPAPRGWPKAGEWSLTCGCGREFHGTPHEAEVAGWDWGVGYTVCPDCGEAAQGGTA